MITQSKFNNHFRRHLSNFCHFSHNTASICKINEWQKKVGHENLANYHKNGTRTYVILRNTCDNRIIRGLEIIIHTKMKTILCSKRET